MAERLYGKLIQTPLGDLAAFADSVGIRRLYFCDFEAIPKFSKTTNEHLELCDEEIRQYFARDLQSFRVKISPDITPFQTMVYKALQRIPYGSTTSYGALASSLGLANCARIIGRANALNPIAIIIPCHRLIGRNGELVGYAGGLQRKKRLIEMERDFAEILS